MAREPWILRSVLGRIPALDCGCSRVEEQPMIGPGQGWGKPAGVCLEKEATRGGRC